MKVLHAKLCFTALAALLMTLVASCSRSCPACNCPVCEQASVGPVGPCTEEWVHMPVIINFPTGGAEIDAQNRAILQQVVATARTRTDIRRVRVEGHTDTCGAEHNNMALSQTRADTVANELVGMGVPRELLETVGYGSTQPRANEACDRRNREELSRQTNRRVEFSILACVDAATAGGAAPVVVEQPVQ